MSQFNERFLKVLKELEAQEVDTLEIHLIEMSLVDELHVRCRIALEEKPVELHLHSRQVGADDAGTGVKLSHQQGGETEAASVVNHCPNRHTKLVVVEVGGGSSGMRHRLRGVGEAGEKILLPRVTGEVGLPRGIP